MILTKIQIQAIDTYLKNSEIEFVDVRMEMLDHVASEVEHKMQTEKLDFYDAFKNYMVFNKKQLQKQNKQFTKTTDIKVLKAIGKFIIKPASFLIFVLFFLVLKGLSKYIVLNEFLRFAPIVIMIGLGLFYYVLVLRFGKKERYSGFERMSLILVLGMQITQLFISPYYQQTVFENYNNANMVFVSFLLVLGLGFITTFLQFKKEYTHRYKNKFV